MHASRSAGQHRMHLPVITITIQPTTHYSWSIVSPPTLSGWFYSYCNMYRRYSEEGELFFLESGNTRQRLGVLAVSTSDSCFVFCPRLDVFLSSRGRSNPPRCGRQMLRLFTFLSSASPWRSSASGFWACRFATDVEEHPVSAAAYGFIGLHTRSLDLEKNIRNNVAG
nr:hypothetical protein CFP56_11356 [Quercus suber]